jgi:hypothetical protein
VDNVVLLDGHLLAIHSGSTKKPGLVLGFTIVKRNIVSSIEHGYGEISH